MSMLALSSHHRCMVRYGTPHNLLFCYPAHCPVDCPMCPLARKQWKAVVGCRAGRGEAWSVLGASRRPCMGAGQIRQSHQYWRQCLKWQRCMEWCRCQIWRRCLIWRRSLIQHLRLYWLGHREPFRGVRRAEAPQWRALRTAWPGSSAALASPGPSAGSPPRTGPFAAA